MPCASNRVLLSSRSNSAREEMATVSSSAGVSDMPVLCPGSIARFATSHVVGEGVLVGVATIVFGAGPEDGACQGGEGAASRPWPLPQHGAPGAFPACCPPVTLRPVEWHAFGGHHRGAPAQSSQP